MTGRDVSPGISVVICVYTEDRWTEIALAVASVQRQTLAAREIILVVDHNARLFERLRQTYRGALVVENKHERGLSGGKNTGIAQASGSIVAFLDDDAEADPMWLACLRSGFARPEVIAVGGRVDPAWADGRRPSWFPEEFDWVLGCSYRGLPTVAGPVRNLFGGNMAVRRRTFDEVGGFRSDLGRLGGNAGGGEEVEFCLRALRHRPAGVMLYLPSARIRHAVPSQRAQVAYFRRRCYGEGASKARLTRMTGSPRVLSPEWRYVTRALPAGVLRGLADPFLRRRFDGPVRAGMIVLGFLSTTAGYCATRFAEVWRRRDGTPQAIRPAAPVLNRSSET